MPNTALRVIQVDRRSSGSERRVASRGKLPRLEYLISIPSMPLMAACGSISVAATLGANRTLARHPFAEPLLKAFRFLPE